VTDGLDRLKTLGMAHKAIVTFTARGFDDIVDEGGSRAWRLDLNKAYHAEYLVCVQNRRVGALGHGSAPSAPHREAFLVGRIREIVPLPAWPERWVIKIRDYAAISLPNLWRGGIVPVRYMTLEDLGIEPDTLHFRALESFSQDLMGQREETTPQGALVEEAKQKLAAAYSVSPDAISIKIKF
jgi:hypothetical protein